MQHLPFASVAWPQYHVPLTAKTIWSAISMFPPSSYFLSFFSVHSWWGFTGPSSIRWCESSGQNWGLQIPLNNVRIQTRTKIWRSVACSSPPSSYSTSRKSKYGPHHNQHGQSISRSGPTSLTLANSCLWRAMFPFSLSLVVQGFPRSGRAKDSINLGVLKGVAGPLTYCSSFASIYKAIYHSFLLQGRFLCAHYVLVPIHSPFSCDSRISLISISVFSCI